MTSDTCSKTQEEEEAEQDWLEEEELDENWEYAEEDDPTPEDTAWRIWYEEALDKKSKDPNSWPPLSVPQTQSELFAILRRPQSRVGQLVLRQRQEELLFIESQFEQPSQSAVQTDEFSHNQASADTQ